MPGFQFLGSGCWERGGDFFPGGCNFQIKIFLKKDVAGYYLKRRLGQFADLRGDLVKKKGYSNNKQSIFEKLSVTEIYVLEYLEKMKKETMSETSTKAVLYKLVLKTIA